MDKTKGYLLPDTAYTEDMVCQLVYYPDKPEYRRALLGSISYLATWIAWEKESEHKGKDAALAWKIALDLTVECWQMACLEQLQDDVAEILAIMRLGQACCDEQDVTDGDQYTDRVEDGVGNVPQNIIDAGYASSSSDWAGFDDYKCMIAHVLVDQIDARLLEFAPIVNSYGAVAGGASAIAAILAVIFGTGGLAIVFGIVAGVGAVSLLYESLLEGGLLEILAAKVVTNHNELACAVYNSDGDADALDSLNDKIDELFTVIEAVILKNMNLGPTLKALYAGRYDQQDIAEILDDAGYDLEDFECDCLEQIGEYLLIWDMTENQTATWQMNSGANQHLTYLGLGCIFLPYPNGNTYTSVQLIRNYAGLNGSQAGGYIDIHRITFKYNSTGALAGDTRCIVDTGLDDNWPNVGAPYTQWSEKIIETFDPPIRLTYPAGYSIQFLQINDTGNQGAVTEITLDIDAN